MGNKINVLSLFDGMACGMIAMKNLDFEINRYVAYEIDKYAVKTSSHNFPIIEHRGDVFQADFTEFEGFDYLIGGSPCTYWSIAQKNNRETEASGMGWELFSQYVRALKEAKPKYFLYENNKSMANAIRESITETFGFEPICINSALVSAQNRQRLYWVGKRNADGTYSKVNIEQPEDKGILLKDVLNGCTDREKARCVTASVGRTTTREYFDKNQNTMTFEAVRIPSYGNEDKSRPVGASYKNKGAGEGSLATDCFTDKPNKQVFDYVAEPVNLDRIHSLKSNDNYIQYDLSGKNYSSQDQRAYYPESKHSTLTGSKSKTGVVEPIKPLSEKEMDYMVRGHQEQRWSFCVKPNEKEKSPCIVANIHKGVPYNVCAESVKDKNVNYPVYEVKDGLITIKGKQYPIKLTDGYYIIRKLSVAECMRLQTVPEWYDFSVISVSQSYKLLGNGWTCDVISWLLKATIEEN